MIVFAVIVIWLLWGIAGAVLYREKGLILGVLFGPVGLYIAYRSKRKAEERARALAAAAERARRGQGRSRTLQPSRSVKRSTMMRWPE